MSGVQRLSFRVEAAFGPLLLKFLKNPSTPKPSTPKPLNPKPETLNPKPGTRNPKP